MSNFTLFHLYGSPNNTKVRIALGFLGIDYERVKVEFEDRSAVLKASGQPLTPTLTIDETAVYDSSAILRYLDANHAAEKRLFGPDSETIRAIEEWEKRTRGGGFGSPVGMLFQQFFSPEKDAAVIAEAGKGFAAQCREIEAALGDDEFLVENRLTAADCCIAPILNFGAPSETFAKNAASPIGDFIMGNLTVPDDCPKVRAYIQRVMAFDA